MKSKDSSKPELRKRLFKSVLTGVLCTGLGIGLYVEVRNTQDEDETPSLLRKVLEFNGRLASEFQTERLAKARNLPPPGKKPRINGDLGLSKPIDLKTYRVSIESGDQKLSLPIAAFQALPKVGYSTEFRCIEGWSESIQYAGGKFSEFMREYHLGKKPDGTYYRYVGLETPDEEYFVSIDMDSMLHPQTVLAYEMNEAPLRPEDGAPLRLIIPVKYGIKHIKRIGRIFFSDTRPPDYWADEGYDWFAGL